MKDPVPAEIAPYVLLGLLHGCEGICSTCVGPEVSGKLAVGAGGAQGNLVLGGGCLGISLQLPTANQTRKKKETKRSAS